ncbi:MAG: hypothetical protein DMF59_14090 [Acidobacteria bacterium]|nr:MAG: hypothetical protein DMF59_14090 [Acidobacteriota bacterium]
MAHADARKQGRVARAAARTWCRSRRARESECASVTRIAIPEIAAGSPADRRRPTCTNSWALRRSQPHRIIRHIEYSGQRFCGGDGRTRPRKIRQESISRLQHPQRGRRRRFSIDGRGGRPAVSKRGQLNAALTALNRLGIEGITIAGLAKREEEIYVPDREEPIRLDRHEPALQLLQMVRDETHRFAVSSHRRRRSKRMLHSELDDLPGIGEKRRRLLIERFGSVSGVKQASEQDLIHVLGRKVGRTLYEELHAAMR